MCSGSNIHADAIDTDMYAAIDALADKLDRSVRQAQGKAARPPRQRGPRRAPVSATAPADSPCD